MNDLQSLYNRVLSDGYKDFPRGLEVTAIKNTSCFFYPGFVYSRKGGNSNIGFVELLQFISSSFDVDEIKAVAPNARLDLFTGQSAYGPRTIGQFDRVINELRHDCSSRRAVVMIAHPTDTSETLPCTLSMQFQVEDDILVTTVNMRSSDLVWGLPTDMIQFGGIAQMIGRCVGYSSSICILNAGNSHVYESTKLKDGDSYKLKGYFRLPDLHNYSEFVDWSLEALKSIKNGKSKVSDIFPINDLINLRDE